MIQQKQAKYVEVCSLIKLYWNFNEYSIYIFDILLPNFVANQRQELHNRKDTNVMWLDNLKEIRKQNGNPTNKKIAENANLPERTIARIFAGDTLNPYVSTLDLIAKALDSSLDEVFVDTKVVVGNEKMAELQETINVVTAERDILTAENVILKDKVVNLTAEIDLLKMKLEHKEEIISIHNYYNKVRSTEK